MKKCASCKQILCVAEFEFKDKKNNRRSSWCKLCTRAYKKRHYSQNKQKYLTGAAVSNYKRRCNIRQVIWEYLKLHPCVDCGECDPVVLEFDHRDPTQKTANVARLVTQHGPLEKVLQQIKDEISKCDVRCANCHRRKTAKEFFWYENPDDFVRTARRKRRNAKKELQNDESPNSSLSE